MPGSFDPITLGHVYLAERACALFDRVIVVAMTNAYKRSYLFTPEERLMLMRESLTHLPRVETDYYDGMLYEYAERVGACAIVKGLRDLEDAEYEMEMARYNNAHNPDAETVFIMASPQLAEVSSTAVKERTRRGESLDGMVAPPVAEALRNKISKEN